MKSVLLLVASFVFMSYASGQTTSPDYSLLDVSKKVEKVKASCGTCMFGMKGTSCELAVRIDKKTYFVDGANIDSFGDSHAKDGFCNAIRKAEVQGEVINDRFKLTYFKYIKKDK